MIHRSLPPAAWVGLLRSTVAITIVFGAAHWASADERAAEELDDAKAKYAERIKGVKKDVLREYDRTIAAIRRDKSLSAAARKDKLDQWTEAKSRFESSSIFPNSDEFAKIELSYVLSLNKAYTPLSKTIDATIEKGIRTSDDNLAELGRRMKTDMERELLGYIGFDANSNWRGTLQLPDRTIPYALHVGPKGEGGSFEGDVDNNPGVAGHWKYVVAGQINGLAVQFWMTRNIRGEFTAVRANGIISGDRLIAELQQTTGRKRAAGMLILRRVR